MNCKDVQNLLSPYLDQALNPEEMQFIQDHLNHCALCEQELRRLRRTIGIIHGLQEVPLPEEFQRQLHHKLIVASKEIKRKKTIWLKLFTRSPWASAGIAALFLLVFYTCFSQVLPREQSDSTVPGTISEQKSASLHDNNWQQANKTTDTGKGTGVSVPLSEKNQKSQENQKVKNPAKGSHSSQEDNSFKEENRQNGGQAARGENKAPPVPKAKAPYSSEEKNSQKTKDQASTQSSIMAIEGIQSGTALKAEKKVNHNIHNIIVELQIGTEEYAQVYQQF